MTAPTGNPPHRPPGRGVVATLRRELLAEGKVTPLVDKVYELAMAGDLVAARLILDRVVPALRTQAARIAFDLPEGGLLNQAQALLHAAASGELSSDQAAELITAVSRITSIQDGDELRRRLDAIEYRDIA